VSTLYPGLQPVGGTQGGVPQTTPPVQPTYPATVHPLDNPDVWSHIVVAGVSSPGICTVSGAERKWKWEKKEAKGKSGASVTGGNKELAEPSFTLKLWRRGAVDHIADWSAFRPTLGTPDPNNPVALDVYHPALEANEIRSVVVQEIGPLTDKGKGMWEVTVKLLEYRKPEPASGTPGSSKSTTKPVETEGEKTYRDAVADVRNLWDQRVRQLPGFS
jgi:hypothetical protein